MDYQDPEKCPSWFDKLKKWWRGAHQQEYNMYQADNDNINRQFSGDYYSADTAISSSILIIDSIALFLISCTLLLLLLVSLIVCGYLVYTNKKFVIPSQMTVNL